MLSLAQAQSLAEAWLAGSDELGELVVLTPATIERSFGWVFFFQSKDPSEQVAGNAPLIVNRATGAVVETGTSEPIEYYLARYEASL